MLISFNSYSYIVALALMAGIIVIFNLFNMFLFKLPRHKEQFIITFVFLSLFFYEVVLYYDEIVFRNINKKGLYAMLSLYTLSVPFVYMVFHWFRSNRPTLQKLKLYLIGGLFYLFNILVLAQVLGYFLNSKLTL